MVRNMVESGPCTGVSTLVAEFPDGTDGVTSRAECIQTKFCSEGENGVAKEKDHDFFQLWPLG